MNHQLEVQVSETGEHFIVLPDSVLLASNINIGDDVVWSISEDNLSATLTKVIKDDVI
jgi:antitoxin component of MazEF toxin-antitoxin module